MAFTYSVPEGMPICVGQKVIVPFGQGNRLVEGFVLNLDQDTDMNNIKDVFQIVEGFSLTSDQVALIQWLKDTYLCTYSEAVTTIVPTGTKLIRTDTFDRPRFEPKSKKQETLLDLLKSPRT